MFLILKEPDAIDTQNPLAFHQANSLPSMLREQNFSYLLHTVSPNFRIIDAEIDENHERFWKAFVSRSMEAKR